MSSWERLLHPLGKRIEVVEIKIIYTAHLKSAAESASQTIQLESGSTLQDCFRVLCNTSPDALRSALEDEHRNLREGIVLCVDDQQTSLRDTTPLRDGSEIIFLAAISGG